MWYMEIEMYEINRLCFCEVMRIAVSQLNKSGYIRFNVLSNIPGVGEKMAEEVFFQLYFAGEVIIKKHNFFRYVAKLS